MQQKLRNRFTPGWLTTRLQTL